MRKSPTRLIFGVHVYPSLSLSLTDTLERHFSKSGCSCRVVNTSGDKLYEHQIRHFRHYSNEVPANAYQSEPS